MLSVERFERGSWHMSKARESERLAEAETRLEEREERRKDI